MTLDATFDFIDPDLLQRELPLTQLAHLRRTAPVWWSEQPGGSQFGDSGYWAISRHADVSAVFPNTAQWSSERNGVLIRLPEAAVDPEQRAMMKLLIINQDEPGHTRLRRLVSRLFTPRAVAVLQEGLRAAAERIVADAVAKGSGDFVADVAAVLPTSAIVDLIGVPEEDRATVIALVEAFADSDDLAAEDGDILEMQTQFAGYAYAMAEERRRQPKEDVVTRLIEPDADGDVLDDSEFAMFLILLAVAGIETTRNSITHGMNAFLDFPEQWDLYRRTHPATAVEEILRWSTPVHCIQRTATADTVLHDVTIREGDRVGLFISSANYDETVFTDPFAFDVSRNPNPHITFGGRGAHYCLGANLARLEIRLMFDEIARQMPGIRKVGEPQRLRSGWINGVRSMQVEYGV